MFDNQLAIVGAGSWGTALALVAAKNDHEVFLWGRDSAQINQMIASHVNKKYLPEVTLSSQIKPVADLSIAIQSVQVIILAVPSQGFRQILSDLTPYLQPHHRLLITTKGLDPVLSCFLTESVGLLLNRDIPVAVLSGPTFASEIAAGQPSAVTLGCTSDDFANEIVQFLHHPLFRVYRTTDIQGVQLGGVVKNVLAIATGIAESLGFGANTQAALITRGLAEMMRLGIALGARMETFLGLAGVGDLILSATNNQSRNRRFGLLIGKGVSIKEAEQSIQQVVEGAHNAEQLYQLASSHHVEMPIVFAVNRVLKGEVSPQEAVDQLLMRSPKQEGQ